MDSNVLNELVIAAEALQALLTLMWLYVATDSATRCRRSIALNVARMLHLHRTLVHENLGEQEVFG